ncbi:MAG TPA: branched-chain amino acid transaminase [Pyrinomonadaceae bacterium]
MSFEQTKWVWMNGQCVPWTEANIHVSAYTLHYGRGVFEGLRCYQTVSGPALFRVDSHLDRFHASARTYRIEIPYTSGQLIDAICEVIRRNEFESCYVRPICYLGSKNLGIRATCPVEVAILAWPWETLLGDEGKEGGVRVTVSPWVKFNSRMIPTTAKACGQYLNSILAVGDALDRGFEEALLLDGDGFIAEGSGENIFLVKNGQIVTNDERHSILLGVTRDAVIKIASDLGYDVEMRAISLDDLLDADEAFFTGTAAEVVPIREVDGSTIGQGGRGPVTKKIQNIFSLATNGGDERYHDWLHHVYS